MTKITRRHLQQIHDRGEHIVVVTAYDYHSARLADQAGVDAILVGDSLGMVIQGHESTLPVTLDHMLYHTSCVTRARPQAHVVADLPFGTFQRGAEAALDAAVRLVQEAGAEAVKIEGAGARLASIEAVVGAEIPVWGHVGLTPQSIHALGGFRVQGREEEAARRLIDQALAVEAAGACLVVLECIPVPVAKAITEALRVPTVGIGAGPHCTGQVLVFHDLLGFSDDFQPRFVKRYAEAGQLLGSALQAFVEDVRAGRFPTEAQGYRGAADALGARLRVEKD